MRYQLKQAVHLKGKDYAKGTYEFSEAVQAEPYFHKLVTAGLIVSADDVGSIKTPQERVTHIQEHLGKVRKATDPKPPLASDEVPVQAKAEDTTELEVQDVHEVKGVDGKPEMVVSDKHATKKKHKR